MNKDLVREVFYKSLLHLLEPIILLKDSVDLMVNNEKIWFYLRVSIIIANWLEVVSFCLVFKSANSTLLYHFYLVRKDDLTNIDLLFNDIVLKIHDEIRECLKDRMQKSVCIKLVPNFFWNLP